MNVGQYLRLKYNTNKPLSLLDMEAIIFGIPLPLPLKWLKTYGKIIVTEEMSVSLSAYLYSNRKKFNAIKAIEILGVKLEPEKQEKLDAIKKENDYIKKVYGTKKVYKETIAASKLKELWR